MANPLSKRAFRIPFDEIRAKHVEPAIDEMLAEAQRHIDAIAANTGTPTYESTLKALEDATENLDWAATVVGHLESVATYPEYRVAYEKVQPKLSRFWTSITLNEDLFNVLTRFAETEEAKGLVGERARHLEKVIDDFRRHGADLDKEGKERIAIYNVELAELTTRFSQNVLDATNAFELVMANEADLAGLPPSAIDAARENAKGKGLDGWRFTLHAPSYIPLVTYLDNAAIRERVWRAYNARGTEPQFDNRQIVRRILELRRLKAELLGYADFADLVLEDRMAGSGQRARGFVSDLRARTLRFFERENAALQRFQTERDGVASSLRPWDVAYYAEKQRRSQFDFDEEELRQYFPVDRVITGLFQTITRLYGVNIEPTQDLPTWDPQVQTYRIIDVDGTHLGSFYVDLYPRENKRDGAWMNGLILATPPEPHLGLFCANANPPVGGKPALFTHREVETLFHEFGHLMHHCLSRVGVRGLAGTNVPWDFVELPSQIMENWCWEREALNMFARHYETGEPIPQGLFEKMVRARTFRAGNAQMRQLGFAELDLALHCDFDPSGTEDVMAFARDVLQMHSPTELPEDFGFIAGFSHLFASPVGYAAAYYSYKWAEVLDADAFTRFRKDGVFSRAAGEAFRRSILERGDSRDPLESYVEFMGREPQLEPLLVRQGLT
jgi:oligopeptidase A